MEFPKNEDKAKKIEYNNGEYYIGQIKNDKRSGKGKLYYKNNNLKYEGDFADDKFEGHGKLIYENGEYYVGEFKDNKKNGEGTIFYPDDTIKFKGVFINDKYKPKKINHLCLYYIIGFLVAFFSFLIIYKNIINKNKIKKIYLNNFEYYIGELKNGFPNGKGKKFNKNE